MTAARSYPLSHVFLPPVFGRLQYAPGLISAILSEQICVADVLLVRGLIVRECTVDEVR